MNENIVRFAEIYDSLTDENRARLAALVAAVLRNQEACADSLQSERQKDE